MEALIFFAVIFGIILCVKASRARAEREKEAAARLYKIKVEINEKIEKKQALDKRVEELQDEIKDLEKSRGALRELGTQGIVKRFEHNALLREIETLKLKKEAILGEIAKHTVLEAKISELKAIEIALNASIQEKKKDLESIQHLIDIAKKGDVTKKGKEDVKPRAPTPTLPIERSASGNKRLQRVGVSKNNNDKVNALLKDVERGYAKAQFELGSRYEHGNGVTQSYIEAVKWYRKAAEQENRDAQFRLAYCYENGRGVESSWIDAITWYQKAARRGDRIARDRMQMLKNAHRGELGGAPRVPKHVKKLPSSEVNA